MLSESAAATAIEPPVDVAAEGLGLLPEVRAPAPEARLFPTSRLPLAWASAVSVSLSFSAPVALANELAVLELVESEEKVMLPETFKLRLVVVSVTSLR